MKNLSFIFVLLILLLSQRMTSAQNPTYALTAKNFIINADSLTFDIYILHTNTGTVPQFEYALGQYFLTFNTAIANGTGTFTYRIIDSGLPSNQQPRNPSVAGNLLRLASNSTVGAGNGFIISGSGEGTLVVRMSLKHSAGFNLGEQLNLAWVNPPQSGLVTKIFAYVGTTNTDITTPGTHNIIISVNQISSIVPEKYEIYQNYPNPFNPSTSIKFDLPKLSEVRLTIYDISGRELDVLYQGKLQPGSFEYKWNASDFASGVYFYRLSAGEFTATKRMMLIK